MTAEERAGELFRTKFKDMPKKAEEYMRAACAKYGGCAEVMLHAYKDYAIEVEGLISDGSFD